MRYFLRTENTDLAITTLKALWDYREMLRVRAGQEEKVAGGKSVRRFGMTFALFVASTATMAADDVLTQAVSFAVTGSDAAKVVAVDRQRCVFSVNRQTFYFNNIYTDRIVFQGKKNMAGSRWTEVALHGRSKLLEMVSDPPVDSGTELDRQMRAVNPSFYEARTSEFSDYTLRVETSEQDRLLRAWQFIYANGCRGLKSPF